MKCTTRSEAIKRYGTIDVGHQAWPNKKKWMALLDIPDHLRGNWCVYGDKDMPVKRIYCNVDIHVPLKQALQNLYDRGFTKELKAFDGCFNIRPVRGSASVSAHAYGLAIDINASENKLGQVTSNLSPGFVKCFTDAGFDWGGNFHSRKDPMHFSFCWEGSHLQENAPHVILG